MYRRGSGKRDPNNKPVKKDVSDSDKYADLLVFGYACKVFRDDERALFHEHGKHLIPWMGDKDIQIDRYDGRGHLHDLSEYDAGSWNRNYQLSEEEARIEALCDEERYLAMHTDLLEEEARQEEEYKRLSEALADEGTYNAVGFRYSADYYDPSQPTAEEEGSETEEAEAEESEEPFVAPPGLVIPSDVELPATTKTHAIIERTANFVSQQGAQFEIVLKAKQSGNSQFDFLRFDHYLNPYYRLVLRAMKEGRYTSTTNSKQDQAQDSRSDDSDDDGDGSYLHPSLFAPKKSSRLEELMKPLQVMDPDHPLAALIRKTKQERNGAAAAAASAATATMAIKQEEVVEPAVTTMPAEYTAAADPNVAAMYYGYCMLPDGSYCLAPPPPGIDANAYYSSLPTGMMGPPPSTGPPPPPGTTPPHPPEPIIIAAPIAAPPPQILAPQIPALQIPAPQIPAPQIPAPQIPAPQIPAPQIPTSTPPVIAENRPQAPAPVASPAIIPPPPDIQPVIDKLAEYVARNGDKFETSVRAKNDPRFDFLQTWNQYNTYYEFKKHYYMQREGIIRPERASQPDSADPPEGGPTEDNPPKEARLIKASFAPICFAIKAKENDMLPLEKNRVRLDDDSDSDPDKMLEEAGLEAMMGGAELIVRELVLPPVQEERRPTLTLEELEAKQAKQRLEDRLAAAAREKLAQASKESKEKQLQAERKRKAALFLQTLRNPLTGEPEARRPDDIPFLHEPQLSDFQAVAAAAPPQAFAAPVYPLDQRHADRSPHRSRDPSSSLPPPSSSSSKSRRGEKNRNRGGERDRERGEKKKKKHKKRSRSRSRSRSPSKSKSKHALPSAYRTVRRSRSPGRKEKNACSSERRGEERERERYHGPGSTYRLGNSPSLSRRHSKSRSPHEKRKKKSSSRQSRTKGSSCSPTTSPSRPSARKSPSPSPPASPASTLGGSRDGSQEKEKQVSSTIVSSVQSKITQDLMARVRAMLAASKTFQPTSP